MGKQKVCCFTGHRLQSLPFGFNENGEGCVKLKTVLKAEIIKLFEECFVTDFISGMAIGVDMFAAEIVLELKNQYPQITLECTTEILRQYFINHPQSIDKYTFLQNSAFTHWVKEKCSKMC